MELGDLNTAQRQAVLHDTGPMLVVAGAGTGKTQVITRRIAHLIVSRQVPAASILALTFTEKAAREMQERVDGLLPYGIVDTAIMTFHSFGDQLLREYGLEIGLEPQFTVMSRAAQLVFMREHFDELKLQYFAPTAAPDSLLGELATYFGRLKEELITPERYLAIAADLAATASDEAETLEATRQQELAAAYETYCRLTRQAGLADFSDQISLVLELFAKRPNIVATLRERYRYILVDEFQDTNVAQNKLVELLAGPAGNVMVVGDDDQSIYKFRGAAISNILAFSQSYKNVKQIVLTQNYRSTQQILDAAYRLIQNNNPDRLEVRNEIDKYLISQSSGPEPELITASTKGLEADQIAVDIKRAIARGTAPSEIAILIRKRSQAQVLINALRAQGVDYYYAGRQSLYDQAEVRTIRDFLQVITNPTDSVALHHLLTSSVFGMDVTLVMELGALAKRQNASLESLLRSYTPDDVATAERLEAITQQLQRWRDLATQYRVGQLVYDFVTTTGYLDALVEASYEQPEYEQKVRNVARFFEILGEYEQIARDTSAIAYMQVAEALSAAGDDPVVSEADVSTDQVQVLTVHAAKGLEFERVYVVDLVAQTFPSRNIREALQIPQQLLQGEVLPTGDWHIQEERRLMYVALTRAKQHLVLSWAPDHGGKRLKKPSPFIAEALGTEPQSDVTQPQATALQQIELFKPLAPGAANLPKARFVQGDYLSLTPHQVDDYLNCPENFYYLHVLEVPQPPAPGLMYGTLIHSLINAYYDQRQHGAVDEGALKELMAKLWRSDGFVSKGQEERRRAAAQATLQRFMEREAAVTRLPQLREHSFQFDVPDLKLKIRGRFDAIYQDEEGDEIRDYKTSEVRDQKKADKRAAESVQLGLYAMAWQDVQGKLPALCSLDFVETGIMGRHVPTESDMQQLREKLRQVTEGIRAGDYEASGNCFYCVHRPHDAAIGRAS